MKVVVFDIDSTLANGEHRDHLYHGRDSDTWDEYITASLYDTPHEEIQWLNHIISYQSDAYIIVLTARSESGKDLTTKWLTAHHIKYNEIIFKPEQDAINRLPDHIFKENVLNDLIKRNLTPFIVFEDNSLVVDMFRSRNIPVCQVRPGKY